MKELKKFVKSLKKYEKEDDFDEKTYLKRIILKERKKNKSIESNELAIKLGANKEVIENILKEIDNESKLQEKNKPKKVEKNKDFIRKIKEKLNKIIDKEDRETVKDLVLKIILFGIPLNFAMFIISKKFFTFNYYTWIGWGIALWFVKKELSPLIRGIIHK